jgi:hypothetical protein
MRIIALCLALASAALAGESLLINGKPLTPAERQQLRRLEERYGAKVQPGSYWYDVQTGLWGKLGEPMSGVILPGLSFHASLPPRASNGDTGVFVNGRELHRTEVQQVSRCTAVQKGRYWLDAQGNGGREGQPASFNLIALCRQNRPGTLGTPGNRGWYGHASGDGSMVGAVFSDGNGVTCGPDGGCIFSQP